MANFDNHIRLVSFDERAYNKLRELEYKISHWRHYSQEGFLTYICPDKSLWGSSQDINFTSVSIVFSHHVETTEFELLLKFTTDLAPATGALKRYQESIQDLEGKLSLKLVYVEPYMNIVGYHINGKEDECDLGKLYQGLVDCDEKSQRFSRNIDMDLTDLAVDYLCIKLISDNHDCDCALCESDRKESNQ